MIRAAHAVVISLGLLGVAWPVRADFALKDDDRVAFFGNKVLQEGVMPMGVESFIRIRYPDLKTRFRSFGRHAAAILRGASDRFEQNVLPDKPTVVVLCFGTDDVPQNPFNEHHFNRFSQDFVTLMDPRPRRSPKRLR